MSDSFDFIARCPNCLLPHAGVRNLGVQGYCDCFIREKVVAYEQLGIEACYNCGRASCGCNDWVKETTKNIQKGLDEGSLEISISDEFLESIDAETLEAIREAQFDAGDPFQPEQEVETSETLKPEGRKRLH